MFKKRQGWLILACAISLAALVGCVGELGGNSGASKTGFCQESGEAGENEPCTSDDDCSSGLRCYEDNRVRFCVVPCGDNDDCGPGACNRSDNGDDNNTDPNNTDPGPNNTDPGPNNTDPGPNNTDPGPNNTDPGPNNTDPGPNNNGNSDAQLCLESCEKLSGCLDQICAQPVIDVQGCQDACLTNPVQADQILASSCDELNSLVCQQGPQVSQVCDCPGVEPTDTNVGSPCSQDADCQGGDQAFCIPDTNPETGEPTGFEGGYCSVGGCQSDAACGDGNFCVQVDQQGSTLCLAGCNNTACRDGYACQDLTGGQQAGFNACVPGCTSDADCGEGGTCSPDGTCS